MSTGIQSDQSRRLTHNHIQINKETTFVMSLKLLSMCFVVLFPGIRVVSVFECSPQARLRPSTLSSRGNSWTWNAPTSWSRRPSRRTRRGMTRRRWSCTPRRWSCASRRCDSPPSELFDPQPASQRSQLTSISLTLSPQSQQCNETSDQALQVKLKQLARQALDRSTFILIHSLPHSIAVSVPRTIHHLLPP